MVDLATLVYYLTGCLWLGVGVGVAVGQVEVEVRVGAMGHSQELWDWDCCVKIYNSMGL